MPALKIPGQAPRKRFTSMVKKHHVLSHQEVKARKKEMAEVNAAYKELMDKEKDKRRLLARRQKEKAHEKKEREILHAMKCPQGVQLIKDPRKVKKMNSKMRKQLVQLPPELLAKLIEQNNY